MGWGVLVPGRPLVASSSLPGLSLSLSRPVQELNFNWGRGGGWTHKHHSGDQCCTPTPCLHARPGSAGGGCGLRDTWLQLCIKLKPRWLLPVPSLRRGEARDEVGVCREPESLRDARSKGSRARGVPMGSQMPPKLISSRRCSHRLGQPLLLALPWLSAASRPCPGSLPSRSAPVTQSVSPSGALPAPPWWSFGSESPWDLKEHPQHKLDLNPHPTL